ncbi:cobalamin biosynthesis protein [Streptomyces sp. NPDC008139]|uniref:cobalamin biosynthesis protein n=1 Tax=Streptomyces sp. NPDC008139 TaxID=3364814 RepID=UPI0036EC711B
MRADRVFAYGAALGFLGDLVAGDPRRGHPVAVFGRAAGALERRMWRDDRGSGAVYAALCAGGAVGAAALADRAVRSSVALRVALTAAATWSVLGGTSLAREARAVASALDAGDIEAARARLPHLCGRDPHSLDAAGIARAVVESVAENTSDAVVGALVWGAWGGVPGLVGFRAVNTLDAMVGHRSPRHLRFGWAAARLDDVVGYPGARLTAALAVLAGPSPRTALRVWRRDAAAHPSPNAGPVEAAFAGALRLRLGGTLSYAGRTEHRAVLGAEHPAPTPADIARAVRLSRRVSAAAAALSVLTAAIRGGSAPGHGRSGERPSGGRAVGVGILSPPRRDARKWSPTVSRQARSLSGAGGTS